MKNSNRVYFLHNHSAFADTVLDKLEKRYDVDVFYSPKMVEDAVKLVHPIAIISTIHSESNKEMMKKCRGIPLKSQFLENYTPALAREYGRVCTNITSCDWLDETLNTSFHFLDSKIVNRNLVKVMEEDKKNNTVPPNGYDSTNVRMKTKESARLIPPTVPNGIESILKEG